MRPSIVTVLTAASWEPRLVEAARGRGMARLRARCSTAAEVARYIGAVDAVVVGSDTPWLSAETCTSWRADGARVVGVATGIDSPAHRLLADADLIVSPTTRPDRILSQIAALPRRSEMAGPCNIVTVVGPRGSPGRTEVALALATAATRTAQRHALLVEVDGEAPGLSDRIGVPQRVVRRTIDPLLGIGFPAAVESGLHLLTVPVDGGPLASSITQRMLAAARNVFDVVIVDAGPRLPSTLPFEAGTIVFVVHPSPAGLARAARMVEEWRASTPLLVVNRSSTDEITLRSIRRATGLEPSVIIGDLGALGEAAPHPRFVAMMRPVLDELPVLELAATSRCGQFDPAVPLAADL